MRPSNPEQLQQFYEDKISHAGQELAALQRQINMVATLRLLLFAAILGLAVWLYQYGWGWIVADVLLGGVLFFAVMQWHDRIFRRRDFARNLLALFQEEAGRLAGQYEHLDTGEEFKEPEHPYTADLDIFGEGSIYQYVSRAGTASGRMLLAGWLRAAAGVNEITERQEAVAELAVRADWRFAFQAHSRSVQEDVQALNELSEWLQTPSFFLPNRFLRVLSYVLPVMAVALWVLSLWMVPVRLAAIFSTLLLGIVGSYTKRINKEHELTAKKYKLLEKYATLFHAIETGTWDSVRMKALQAALKTQNQAASLSLKKLGRIVSSLDSRYNLLGTVIANGLYMRDLHNIYSLEHWKEQHRATVTGWLGILSEVDALASFGSLAFNHPAFVFPEAKQEDDFHLSAAELGHPLIPSGKRVGNDLAIKGWAQLMLITGSNMGGKSTFLRAVGANMVLAMAGAPVCASSFSFTPVQIYTSMRVGDSIRNSESTFYAELKRLKTIIDRLTAGERLFILLDEILRGTNSADKLTGSEALLRQLVALQGSGIVATHDLALSALEKEYPSHIHNYNFEVQITGDQFYFDYKLKPGVCKTMNATLLMKKMGIRMN